MGKIPIDLRRVLVSTPKAKVIWEGLTPDARRDFVRWIDLAKESEARGVRIAKVCVMLAAGKRHPVVES